MRRDITGVHVHMNVHVICYTTGSTGTSKLKAAISQQSLSLSTPDIHWFHRDRFHIVLGWVPGWDTDSVPPGLFFKRH